MGRAARILALFLTLAASVYAGVTSNLTGVVRHEGSPLSGVIVTIASVSMQGKQSTRTDVNGRYAFVAIPPGSYSVSFRTEGMQDATASAMAGVGQTARADADLRPDDSASLVSPATVETKSVQTNLAGSMVDRLPIGRDPASAVSLAVGSGLIGGAPQVSSSWLIDEAATGDPLGRAPVPMYVEDAIQETTLLSAAIPAEYGRFGGGVANTITKSGGNAWAGSFRDSFSNPSWTAPSPYQNIQNTDQLNQTFEATLGGPVLRDRLWLFAAGRSFSETTQKLYALSPSWGYTTTNDDRRRQLKLTGNIGARHTLAGSILQKPVTTHDYCFVNCAEPSAIDPQREVDSRAASARYSGIVSQRLVVEAFWSRFDRKFTGGGGDSRDQVNGTTGTDDTTGARFGAPTFCGVCEPETRFTSDYGVKATWFLSTERTGTHTLTAGLDRWAADAIVNNHQSGSDYHVYLESPQTYGLRPGDVFHPVIRPGDFIGWWPIIQADRPSNQQIRAAFVNDRWDLGPHWSLNAGFRYDKNDLVDESGLKVSDTAALQPRLAAVWDVQANGRYRVNASYSRYADLYVPSVISSTWLGGAPMALQWQYEGPVIQGLPTTGAFARLFDWFNAQCDSAGHCGSANMDALYWAGFGNGGTKFGSSLKSPEVEEAGAGFSFSPAPSAFLRLDAVRRDWRHYLVGRVTHETGQTADPFGNPLDWTIIENDDTGQRRTWSALMLQASGRAGTHWTFGGNYTFARTTTNNIPTGMQAVDSIHYYPELTGFKQWNPVASYDEQHLRAWGLYTLSSRFGTLDLSALENFDTGNAYSLSIAADTAFAPAVVASYANAPPDVTYFVNRFGLRRDAVTSTDLGIRYEFPLVRTTGVFVDFSVANVFNEAAQVGGNGTVLTHVNRNCKQTANPALRCAIFNPFTETPVEGVHYVKGPLYGKATSTSHYQTPRTYSFSTGVRF